MCAGSVRDARVASGAVNAGVRPLQALPHLLSPAVLRAPILVAAMGRHCQVRAASLELVISFSLLSHFVVDVEAQPERYSLSKSTPKMGIWYGPTNMIF